MWLAPEPNGFRIQVSSSATKRDRRRGLGLTLLICTSYHLHDAYMSHPFIRIQKCLCCRAQGRNIFKQQRPEDCAATKSTPCSPPAVA